MHIFGRRPAASNAPVSVWHFAGWLLAGINLLSFLRGPLSGSLQLWLAIAVVLLLCCRRLQSLAFLPLGLLLVSVDAANVSAQKLDPALAMTDTRLRVRLVDFPAARDGLTRLLVEPLSAVPDVQRLRLSWYDAPRELRLGECWTMTVRLRRPRGWSNPSLFDYERWLFLARIGATGYVKSAQRLPCPNREGLREYRQGIADRVTALLPADAATAVLLAITIGARHQIEADQWQQYARTGTSHLMAISGMHIGLAAGTSYLLAWCASAVLRRRGNHRIVAGAVSVAVAAVYVALAGFAIPARRAFIMLALAVLAVLLRHRLSGLHVVSVTLIGLAVASPLDVLTPGFQLSFAAVGILWLQSQRLPGGESRRGLWRAVNAARQLSVLQIGLLLGMLPLTGLLFARAGWLAPMVNLLVLPIFNVAAVPAALGGILFDGPCQALGDELLWLAWRSIHAILIVVERAARIPYADLHIAAPAGIGFAILLVPCLWALLPVSFPGRRLAWVAAVATVLQAPLRPPAGCLDLHVLDVGQGLASVLVSATHIVVFDTGPAFRSGANAARLVVTPFLRSIGATQIDLLVLSHGDLDHAGGAAVLGRDWEITAALVGEASSLEVAPQWFCTAGQAWSWDGIRFRVLQPMAPGQAGNNASCVLEVQSGSTRLLLTGDIEARAERRLLASGLLASADIVQIPHHGSRTSSSPAFVEALGAGTAIASAGFGNRWGMPRDEVVRRWQEAGADVYNTADDGAISVRLCADSDQPRVESARRRHRNVWHETG